MNRIEAHVNELFSNMPSDLNVLEVKEELLSNLNEKYNDLIGNGKSEEDAYVLTIESIGDIQDLFVKDGVTSPAEIEKKRNLRSAFVSLGVTLYILSLAAMFVLTNYGFETVAAGGVTIFICAIATGLVVYGINMGKTKYVKADNSFVENYKEKVLENDRIRKVKWSISSSLWSLVLVVYLGISFFSDMWAVTWIIFPVAVFIQLFVLYLLSNPGKKKSYFYGMLWSIALVIYLTISFAFNAWSWTWMIFLATLAVQEITRLITVLRRS